MRTIYLVRHGRIEMPAEGKCYIGRTDVPLSEAGREDAVQTAGRLCRLLEGHGSPARICTSPLIRCRETAAILAGRLEIPSVEVIDAFAEIDLGDWEGRTIREIRAQYPKAYEKRGMRLASYHTPGGESFYEAGRRFCDALHTIRQRTAEDILIVSHAGVISAALGIRAGIPPEEWTYDPLPYGGIHLLQEEEDI